MDDAHVPRLEIGRGDPSALRQAGRQDEDAVLIRSGGSERIRLAHLEDQVGWTERPFGLPHLGRRGVLGIALGCARLGPVCQGSPLAVGQHTGVAERAPFRRGRVPGGHGALLRHRRDVVGALPRLGVIEERERRDLPRAMAFLAVLLEDGDDVAVIGRGVFGPGHRAGHQRESDEHRRARHPPSRFGQKHVHRAILFDSSRSTDARPEAESAWAAEPSMR